MTPQPGRAELVGKNIARAAWSATSAGGRTPRQAWPIRKPESPRSPMLNLKLTNRVSVVRTFLDTPTGRWS